MTSSLGGIGGEADLAAIMARHIEEASRKRYWAPLPHQVPPIGSWLGWLMLAGRGAGKTEACARYVVDHVNGPPCIQGSIPHWMAIIAPTLGDAATACFAGPSGIRHFDDTALLSAKVGGLLVTWPNGAQAKMYGARDPDDVERLRAGGNTCLVWMEELAAWRYLEDAFDQMRFGLRVGPRPHWIASTTPKPRPLIKRLVKHEIGGVALTHATMYDNPHLPTHIKNALEESYAGTSLGTQELYGKLIDQDTNALWTRDTLERTRRAAAPPLRTTQVGVDPSGGAGEQGIVVVGRADEMIEKRVLKHGYVLHDASVRMKPEGWARTAVTAAVDWDADAIVVETNFGGDQAVALLVNACDQLGTPIPIRTVHASRGKRPRAEPVSALAEQNRWHLVGYFDELEDQMCVVADTLVRTSRGRVRIQHVRAGDFVLTRRGWKPVLWSGMTGVTTVLTSVHVQDGIVLRCTPSHPVYLPETDEFVRVANVRPGDRLSVACTPVGTAILSRGEVDGGHVHLREDTDTAEVNSYHMRFGARIEERYLTDISSITSTMILTTTDLRTLSASRTPNTRLNTAERLRCDDAPSCRELRDQRDRLNVDRSGSVRSRDHLRVHRAARCLSRVERTHFVAPRVVLDVVTEIVHPTPVYNLTVDDQPEFFANDVLVHNCTWTTDTSWSPDRIDAMVWPAWSMKIVSTLFRSVGTFGGSQMVHRTLGRRRSA